MTRKSVFFILLVVVAVGGVAAFYFLKMNNPAGNEIIVQSLSRMDKPEPRKLIMTSNANPKLGEVFTINVSGVNEDNTSKVVIKIDAKVVKTCEKDFGLCLYQTAAFVKKDIGSHNYSVEIVKKNGATAVYSGTFVVVGAQTTVPVIVPLATIDTPALPTQPKEAPLEISSVVTSGDNVKTGEVFSATVYVKDTVIIDQIQASADGYTFKTCKSVTSCKMVLGPMNTADIGRHAYSFIVKTIGGQTSQLNGTFTVSAALIPVAPVAPDKQAPSILVSVANDTIKADETVVIQSVASDNVGVTKIALTFDSVLIKECFNVTSCSQEIGPFYGILENKQYLYKAEAFDAAGNWQTTAIKYLTVAPATIIEPTITVKASSDTIAYSASATFSVTVNPGSKKIDYINYYFDTQVVKVCYASCAFSFGPFTDYAGKTITFYARAYFTDGRNKSSAAKTVTITAPAPKISASFAPVVNAIPATEIGTINSVVDPDGKTIFAHWIYVNGVNQANCMSATCSYSKQIYIMMGTNPNQGGTLKYYSKVLFLDGSSYESTVGSVTVTPVAPS
ncbi:MAG: hypothetical protein V1902_01725 [Candidatus Falkowbacteria bacterium]